MIYKFTCKHCPAIYIGESKIALGTRINNHLNCYNKGSVVSQHIAQGHSFDWDNVKILYIKPTQKKRLISEMLNITKNSDTINKKENIQSLSRAYKSSLQ